MSLRTRFLTRFEQSLSFFPLALVALTAWLAWRGQWAVAFLAPYLVPLAAFRAINLFFPLREGASFIGERGYSPWLGAHKLQLIYLHFPVLERVLRLVPGLYSLWLRAWGSRIGRAVYWTPRVDITDRTNLIVGDHVFFGDKVHLVGHAVKPRDGRFRLFYRPIAIGSGSFIGAYSRIAPGVTVRSGSAVPVGTDLYPGATFDPAAGTPAQRHPSRARAEVTLAQ